MMKDRDLEKKHEGDLLFYKDGEVIFEQYSAGREIYIIEDGRVAISQRFDGRRIVLAELKKGDFFGEMAPITGVLRSATATAVGDVFLVALSMEEMIDRMKTDSVLMVTMLQRLMNRLRRTNTRLRASNSVMVYASNGEPDGEEGRSASTGSSEILEKMTSYLRRRIEQKDKQAENLQKQLEQSQLLVEKQKNMIMAIFPGEEASEYRDRSTG